MKPDVVTYRSGATGMTCTVRRPPRSTALRWTLALTLGVMSCSPAPPDPIPEVRSRSSSLTPRQRTDLARLDLEILAQRAAPNPTKTTFAPWDPRAGLRVGYSEYGTISHLHGVTFSVPKPAHLGVAASDEQVAADFLSSYQGLHGLDGVVDTFELESAVQLSAGGSSVRFRQKHLGVNVRSASVVVLVNAKKEVIGYIAKTSPAIVTSPTPAVASATALLQVKSQAAFGSILKVDLEYSEFAGLKQAAGGSVPLVWAVRWKNGTGETQLSYYDAASGKHLKTHSAAKRHIACQTNKCSSQTFCKSVAHDHDSNKFRWDMECLSSLPTGPLECGCSCCSPDGGGCAPGWCPGCSCLDTVLNNLWNWQEQFVGYLRTRFGRFSWDGHGSNMHTLYDPDRNASHWDGDEVFVDGTRSDCPAIIGHEWGHGVSDHECGFDGDDLDQPYMIEEGLSDLMGIMAANPPNYWYFCNNNTGVDHSDPSLKGFRNWREDRTSDATVANAELITFPGVLASRQPPNPNNTCAQDSDCPSGHCGTPDMEFGDLAGTCVQKVNGLWVPYVGKYHGHGPFYDAVNNHILPSSAHVADYFSGVWAAANAYDIGIGHNPAVDPFVSRSVIYSLWAAGFYDASQPLSAGRVSTALRTNNRPAFVPNFCYDPRYEPSLGVFVQDWQTKEIRWSISPNGITFRDLYSAPIEGTRNVSRSGSGIVAVTGSSLAPAVLVYKSVENNDILWQKVRCTERGPVFEPPLPVGGYHLAQTLETPAAVAYDNTIFVLYKDASSDQVKYVRLDEASVHGVPEAWTGSAPTATVAQGRIWMAFRSLDNIGADSRKVYFSSYDLNGWSGRQRLTDSSTPSNDPDVRTAAAPEIMFYRDRLWFAYVNPPWVWVISGQPASDGSVAEWSRTVHMSTTDIYYGSVPAYLSYVVFGPVLRLHYKRGTDQPENEVWCLPKVGGG